MEATTAKPKNTGTKQLFKNPILEKLTRTHILVPLIIFNAFGGWLAYYGITEGLISGSMVAITFVLGALAFTWVEYNVHRHIFHMLPTNKLKESIQYKFHGVHHEYPKDKTRLAMPPAVSIFLAIGFFYFFRFLMGDYVFGFLPGFLFSYTYYLGVHYAVHAFRPPNNFLKVLWVNHGIHHYKDHDRAFGVSSPLWDFIYRTLPQK
jgi:sterol desaturase/sphingolipid hydroxylase (fatty acid hydroxylase superfamily)